MIALNNKQRLEALESLPLYIFAQHTINTLSGLCEGRYRAIAYYPNSLGANKKFEEIAKIRYRLAQAKLMLNPKEAIAECLNLQLSFKTIEGAPTKKLHQSYLNNLNTTMDACRAQLGRVKQW
jgi:hypothetical protein